MGYAHIVQATHIIIVIEQLILIFNTALTDFQKTAPYILASIQFTGIYLELSGAGGSVKVIDHIAVIWIFHI